MVRRIPVLFVLLISMVPVRAAGAEGVTFTTTSHRFVMDQEPVVVVLHNNSDDAITTSTWTIYDVRAGEPAATYDWDGASLEPGEELTWSWQQERTCEGICTRPCCEQERTWPSRYKVVAETSAGNMTEHFRIGQYFRLGFEDRPKAPQFVVFSDNLSTINDLTELGVNSQRIIGGDVGRARSYNPEWIFSLGPSSIVVKTRWRMPCDEDPFTVQRDRRDWMRKRWCPSDAFVAGLGR